MFLSTKFNIYCSSSIVSIIYFICLKSAELFFDNSIYFFNIFLIKFFKKILLFGIFDKISKVFGLFLFKIVSKICSEISKIS